MEVYPTKLWLFILKQSLSGTPLCRKGFFDHDSEHQGQLGGENHVVKIDQAKFGKRNTTVGGEWRVIGCLEALTGRQDKRFSYL